MKIAVLFDGAGLARLGLEMAGHDCTGVELNPIAHYLSLMVGSGNCLLGDATIFDLSGFDAVWASPPCQQHSVARTQGAPRGKFAVDYLDWSLSLETDILWVENVYSPSTVGKGKLYNAAQFLEIPIQQRRRIIGGRFLEPSTFRPFQFSYSGVCPAITASEDRGCASDARRASRFYGRKITIEEAAYHQGFSIPPGWLEPALGLTPGKWRSELYRAIGNGVPVYMARAFGEAYARCT